MRDFNVRDYFLPFVNIALRSRDMFTPIWGHFAKIPMSLYILIRKNAPKIGGKWLFLAHFWSLDEVVGDLGSHVCPYVRPYVRLFLGNRSLLFSETLQLVSACKREKNFPSVF